MMDADALDVRLPNQFRQEYYFCGERSMTSCAQTSRLLAPFAARLALELESLRGKQ